MSENFEEILEESLQDPETAKLLEEKALEGERGRMSVREIAKDYPGPQREIDLHGHTGAEAMRELEHFITRSIQQHVRTVRVITGKGRSVLLQLTEQSLARYKRDGKVLAFRKEKSGGSYVVYLIS